MFNPPPLIFDLMPQAHQPGHGSKIPFSFIICLASILSLVECRRRTNQDVAKVAAEAEEAARKKPKPKVNPNLPLDTRTSLELVKEMYATWRAPIETLSKAGKAFDGLEALLGGAQGGTFELGVSHERPGWGVGGVRGLVAALGCQPR